jgi:hypothetical protein
MKPDDNRGSPEKFLFRLSPTSPAGGAAAHFQ